MRVYFILAQCTVAVLIGANGLYPTLAGLTSSGRAIGQVYTTSSIQQCIALTIHAAINLILHRAIHLLPAQIRMAIANDQLHIRTSSVAGLGLDSAESAIQITVDSHDLVLAGHTGLGRSVGKMIAFSGIEGLVSAVLVNLSINHILLRTIDIVPGQIGLTCGCLGDQLNLGYGQITPGTDGCTEAICLAVCIHGANL